MMPLYLCTLIASVFIPLIFTLVYKDFIRDWKNFFISTSAIAFVFLVWDYYFTKTGVWEFNPDYCIGMDIFMMPLEEWIFFFAVPFCSLFLHFVLKSSFKNMFLSLMTTKIVTILIIVFVSLVLRNNLTKDYTAINSMILITTLVLGLCFHQKLLQRFYLSFLIILIPFFIVNGILTGYITEEPVVKYNDLENLGIRISTIPVEDVGYAFSLLFGNLMIFEWLKQKKVKQQNVPVS
tara:strand:+ start:1356 stop:2063 length:708 start_codon:yes stop_codon:yes gene_type:complete